MDFLIRGIVLVKTLQICRALESDHSNNFVNVKIKSILKMTWVFCDLF